ncbi:dystroglycan-related [Anaeramoeba flamelloides]|uniref:Dystroglycan-related n=1 Tax=Anaeramoeba flamelloides TaxID=1746091 RepID=A0ABQ8XRA3_9EUKA|nr:dystroglycan-related [Anaeramoeba flamelloides]
MAFLKTTLFFFLFFIVVLTEQCPKPQGSSFQINVHSTGNQDHPSVSAFNDYEFVCTWTSEKSSSSDDISGQELRWPHGGYVATIGEEFLVNNHTNDVQNKARLATHFDHDMFVIIFHSEDPSYEGIYGQVYTYTEDSTPIKRGKEFQADSGMNVDPKKDTLTLLDSKTFVAVWQAKPSDSSNANIYSQIFNITTTTPTKIGEEMLINDENDQATHGDPSIANLVNDMFIVAYELQDGEENQKIFGQAIDGSTLSDPQKIGAQFEISSKDNENKNLKPEVIHIGSEYQFLVSWISQNENEDQMVMAQLYEFDGASQPTKLSEAFQVSTDAVTSVKKISVAELDSDQIFFVYQSITDGWSDIQGSIFSIRSDGESVRFGQEFYVNTDTSQQKEHPMVSYLGSSRIIAVWNTINEETDSQSTSDIEAQSYIIQNNNKPQIKNSLSEQTCSSSTELNYQFASDTFEDPDGDQLRYTAFLDDDSSLPDWITFDRNERLFTGTPPNESTQLKITVMATDVCGESVTNSFNINLEVSPSYRVAFSSLLFLALYLLFLF